MWGWEGVFGRVGLGFKIKGEVEMTMMDFSRYGE